MPEAWGIGDGRHPATTIQFLGKRMAPVMRRLASNARSQLFKGSEHE
jgi:hypothetical protein